MASAPSCEPEEGVKYPIKVEYCPFNGLPYEVKSVKYLVFGLGYSLSKLNSFQLNFQYLEYYPDYADCKKWMEESMPDRYEFVTM